MSSYVCRKNDMSTGHREFPPRMSIQGSDNVLVNNRGITRQGDQWQQHCSPEGCHTGTIAIGSTTVFINGKGCGKVGDALDCGDFVMTGSSNVLCG